MKVNYLNKSDKILKEQAVAKKINPPKATEKVLPFDDGSNIKKK